MKSYKYILLTVFMIWATGCKKLDISPQNIVQDPDLFTTSGGIDSYMARIYSELPIEDFRYSPTRGLNFFWIISPFSCISGEGLSRDQTSATQETFGYWSDAYHLIRECNYLMETLPTYKGNFSETQVNNWLGEARFIRGATYFALVKRYGGVPIVDKVLTKPGESISQLTETIEELKIPRSAEAAVYDFVGTDLDFAYTNLPESNTSGRASKYAAAAFKSRAMLYAGTIAKYNQVNLTAGGAQVCGIPAGKAAAYFKASYDAAKLLDGKYSLYKKNWAAGDKDAQYQNYVNLFFDEASNENVFVKEYHYPESVHGYDSYNVPRQLMGGNGYSSEINPTLNLVEMYDGLPKNADGTLQTVDASGNYILYNNTMDVFANAEPRLRATVILPGDQFKNQSIEIRRGIYTGNVAGGISRLLPAGSTSNYPAANLVTSSNAAQTPYKLPNGTLMNPAGLSGIFTGDQTCAISGFSVRKWLVPDKPTSEVLENHSDQTWIEMRYAEVLLNMAEAAFELNSLGQSGTYLQDAFTAVNQVRDRAGATLLTGQGELTVDVIRKERRKELAFENKTWWDLRRWRILDKEQNNTLYRVLMPFYSSVAGKYFFDARFDERNARYTFDPRWYYEQIPQGAIAKSTNIVQNPGY
jgi:hypothetical protein